VKRLFAVLLVIAALGAAGWQGRRMYSAVKPQADTGVPVTAVKRGDLTFTVTAKGDLHGGNSEMLSAPLTTGSELHITTLRKSGDLVSANDTVVEFDATDQEFRLKEAESDLAEAELKVKQARAQAAAQLEEDTYSLAAAESAVRVAQFDVRKNPVLPAIQARQNDLALKAAEDRLTQIRQDIGSRKETNGAAIKVQEAGVGKATIELTSAKKNIESLSLRAHRTGYVSLKPNTSVNFFMDGMSLPIYQAGDTVRGGMVIAEIPDLSNWELSANIGELDRGHLAVDQQVDVTVIALPGRPFHARVKDLGGTGGPPWNRRFACKMHLEDPVPQLRPGMSVLVQITTDHLKNALWIPAQALFESGSRTYVYVPSGNGFAPKDVKLERRSESQVVVAGLSEGQVVALTDPDQQQQKKPASTSASPLPK
jgi:HlyD family secretion protein